MAVALPKFLPIALLITLISGCAAYPRQNYYPRYPAYSRSYTVERNYYPAPRRNRLVIKREYYDYRRPQYPYYGDHPSFRKHYSHRDDD